MKSLIFWIVAITFALLTAKSAAMGEYLFALTTGFLAVACLAGTGTEKKTKPKSKASDSR